jgi:hypothetical protein
VRAGLFFVQRLADEDMPRGARARSQVSAATGWLKGGKASHAKGVAHQWTTEEVRAAGRKGGRKRTRQQKK